MIKRLVTRLLDKITNGVPSAEQRFGTWKTELTEQAVRTDRNAPRFEFDERNGQ